MSIIREHLEFIIFIRQLAKARKEKNIVNLISKDSRDKMGEADYYGLKALETAENFFDSLDCAESLAEGKKPEGAFYVIYQQPHKHPTMAPAVYIDNELHFILYGGKPIPYNDELSWHFIAFQKQSDYSNEGK
jgi:hypothetical protein